MTSPTEPPKEPLRDRISTRLSTDGSGRYMDDEARKTRNVTWAFVGLIVVVAIIAVVGLAYGFYDSNLKPLASAGGQDVGRAEWEDRQELEALRADRAETAIRAALAEGAMDTNLADRRLNAAAADRPTASAVMTELVDLLYQEQLATERGLSVSGDELAAALTQDGMLPEARRIGALIIASSEQSIGLPPTAEGQAEARAQAEEALVRLQAGESLADLSEEYSIPNGPVAGDIGWIVEGEITEPVWSDQLFALEAGGITDIVPTETGEYLIGVVTEIFEPRRDPGFLNAARAAIGEEAHDRNVELETLATKLEADVVADATSEQYDQVRLAEILVAGSTWLEPEEDEGQIRASHILYQPTAEDDDGETIDVAEIPEDDPSWDAAGAEAEAAAADLRAIEDTDGRVAAFVERARSDSDGPTGATGGDLGFFTRDAMVEEFSTALFDLEDPHHGDIVGPVRSEFGWHVIMYDDFEPPIADRLAEVEAALAEPGAEFATVAAEYSDGVESVDGGKIGWQVLDELDGVAVDALEVTEVGEISVPVDGADGWVIYQKLEEDTRPLEPDAAARVAATAFLDWYDELKFAAEDDGTLRIDDSVYAEEADVPVGGHGG